MLFSGFSVVSIYCIGVRTFISVKSRMSSSSASSSSLALVAYEDILSLLDGVAPPPIATIENSSGSVGISGSRAY